VVTGGEEERDELRRALRRYLEERMPVSRVRRVALDADPAARRSETQEAWRAFAHELGVIGLVVPEADGGAAAGERELGVVMEELGRTLAFASYLSTAVLAAPALAACGHPEVRRELFPRILTGESRATLALTEPVVSWDPADVVTVAERRGADFELSGVKRFVLDGAEADLLFVVARVPSEIGEDEGIGLFLIDRASDEPEGVRVRALPTLDATRPQAEVSLDAAPARLVGPIAGTGGRLREVVRRASVALCAEQVGGAARCLEMSVAYAKDRIQFGRPIGSFQAVKHACADMLCDVESARSAAEYAAAIADEGNDDLRAAASLAKAFCSEAYVRTAEKTVQVHGGVGFTWEHDAHLYLKRAKTDEILFGGPRAHLALLADAVGI
jgi:alkylation response protein AidB-like acyl-CoA dehydrogenase